MCLAIPTRVVALQDGAQALVDVGGVHKSISLALLDDVQEGDWVIVHVGHAIGKLDPAEAARTLALFAGLTPQEAP
ncbi:MAG: HypC/HybG/HupF family hydrogenase formation chaperone [Proteobacteria bacterium]|nr:HypC/HybG/HupF family hydrogenase formation chaperone [Pseudomonadota bacterium]